MKQHITVEQAKELGQKTIGNLGESFYSAMYFYSKLEHEPRWDFAANLMTIGKMIEILGNKVNAIVPIVKDKKVVFWSVYLLYDNMEMSIGFEAIELADALFEAVKYVLGVEE